MRLGIDLDGCCYDFHGAMRRYLTQRKGYAASELPEPDRWNVWDCWGLDRQEWQTLFVQGVAEGVLFRQGDTYPDVAWTIDRLRAAGHTIHIVTDRDVHPAAASSTTRWLADQAIPYDTLTFSSDKTVVPVDVFIEDSPDNARTLEDAGVQVLLMDRPWNRGEHVGQRVHGWGSVYDEVSMSEPLQTETVLVEAERLVGGDRQMDYGHPRPDFARTGRMWGAILGIEDVSPEEVGLCMIALKLSREVNAHKRDNIVDMAGYARCVDLIHGDGRVQ